MFCFELSFIFPLSSPTALRLERLACGWFFFFPPFRPLFFCENFIHKPSPFVKTINAEFPPFPLRGPGSRKLGQAFLFLSLPPPFFTFSSALFFFRSAPAGYSGVRATPPYLSTDHHGFFHRIHALLFFPPFRNVLFFQTHPSFEAQNLAFGVLFKISGCMASSFFRFFLPFFPQTFCDLESQPDGTLSSRPSYFSKGRSS